MMTAKDLIGEVREATLGASYSDATILRYLNRASLRVAGIVLLPLLEASSQVQTDPGKAWVNLPQDYHRELQRVTSQNGRCLVKHFRSFLEFTHHAPLIEAPRGGHVEATALRGAWLYYHPIVSEPGDTLTLYYYRKPTPMVAPDDPEPGDQLTPDGLPPSVAEDILVNYAAMELWKLIEQDDNNQPNVTKFERRFNVNMAELVLFLGPPDGDPVYVRDMRGC